MSPRFGTAVGPESPVTVGEVSNIRVHGCKIWNTDSAIQGPVDGLRVRDTELHEVGSLTDGQAIDVETRDNDSW